MDFRLILTILFAVCHPVACQTWNAGNSTMYPLMVKKDSGDQYMLTLDEDPESGDRVYGMVILDKPYIGLRKTSQTMDDLNDWQWLQSIQVQTNMSDKMTVPYETRFTLDKLPFFNTKLINVITIIDNEKMAVQQWINPKSSLASGVKMVSEPRLITPAKTQLEFQTSLISTVMKVAGNDIHMWLGHRESFVNTNQYLVRFANHFYIHRYQFDASSDPVTLQSADALRIYREASWPTIMGSLPYFQMSEDQQFLFMHITVGKTNMDSREYDMHIYKWAYPTTPPFAGFQNGMLKMYKRHFTNQPECKDLSGVYQCSMRTLSPSSLYGDKLRFLEYTAQKDNNKYWTNDIDTSMKYHHQCDDDKFFAIKLTAPLLVRKNVNYAYTRNATTTYFFINKYPGSEGSDNQKASTVIMVVNFNPDTSNCASLTLKTPSKAHYYVPKYMTLDEKEYSYERHFYGSVMFSKKTNGLYYVGTTIRTKTKAYDGTSGRYGFADSIPIGDMDQADVVVPLETDTGVFTSHTDNYVITDYNEVPTSRFLTVSQTILDVSKPYGFKDASFWYNKCYRTLRIKSDTKYYAGSVHEWSITAKSYSSIHALNFNEIWETTSTDSDCKITYVLDTQKDHFGGSLPSSSWFVISDFTKQSLALSNQQSFGTVEVVLKAYNSVDYVSSPRFKVTQVLHPCSKVPPKKSLWWTYIPYPTFVDVNGAVIPNTAADLPPYVETIFKKSTTESNNYGWVYPNSLTDCPISIVVTRNFNPYEGWDGNEINKYLSVDETTSVMTFKDYHGLNQTWANSWNKATYVYANVKSDYWNTMQSTMLLAFSFKGHDCQSKTIDYDSNFQFQTVTLTQGDLILPDWDSSPILDKTSSAKPVELDMNQMIKSSDETLCPIKEFATGKVLNRKTNKYETSVPAWISTDKVTGKMTFKDYSLVTSEPDLHWEIYIKATTKYSYFLDHPHANKRFAEVMIKDGGGACKTKTLKALASFKPIAQGLWYNTWVSDTNSTVLKSSEKVEDVRIKIKDVIKSEDPQNCPIMASRMKELKNKQGSVVEKTTYEKHVKYADDEIVVTDYKGLDPKIWDGLTIGIQSRTKSVQSIAVPVVSLTAKPFLCDKENTLKVDKDQIKSVNVTYETFVPTQGEPVVNQIVSDTIIDMSTGFFDKSVVKNCSLTQYMLTKVTDKEGIEIMKSNWEKMFVYAGGNLKITAYAGANSTQFEEAKLYFQSSIDTTTKDLSHAYHLVTVTIFEKKTLSRQGTSSSSISPKLTSLIQPIFVVENFTLKSRFDVIEYTLPGVTDPNDLKMKPTVITNLAKYPFVSFDDEKNKVSVDPNLIGPQLYFTVVDLNVKFENSDGVSSESSLMIIIENTAQQVKEEPEVQPEPESEPKEQQEETEPEVESVKQEKKEPSPSPTPPKPVVPAFIPKYTQKEEVEEPETVLTEEEEKPQEVDKPWVRPSIPAELSLMTLGSKGEFSLEFDQPVVLPDDYHKKFKEDQKIKKALESKQISEQEAKRRLQGQSYNVIKLAVKEAGTEKVGELNHSIESITDKGIQMKVTFENPEYMSMSDQSNNDQMVVELAGPPIVGSDGTPISKKGLETNDNGDQQTGLDIQPMVNEGKAEVKLLESASKSIFYAGFGMIVLQFLLTYILSSSLEFFWNMINSQINFIYMPLMTVNAPGQVSFYLQVLIYVCTFDPIPMDVIDGMFPFFSFEKVTAANNIDAFSRIGLKDRSIITVLGSLILFMAMFVLTQVIYHILNIFSQIKYVRKVMAYFTLKSAYRTLVILFFLEIYMDLTLGGMLNTENDYLLDDSSNWGPRGMLTKSDQVCIILGNIVYILTQTFPFVIMLLTDLKFQMRYRYINYKSSFDTFYNVLYKNLRTEMAGPFQYYSAYLLRRLLYAYVVFYLTDESQTLLQIVCNLWLSLLFCLYLAAIQPFLSPVDNKIQLLNEWIYYMVSLLYLCFTDFNLYPEMKALVGWLIVLLAIANLICPNFILMTGQMRSDVRNSCQKRKLLKLRQQRSVKRLQKFRDRLMESNIVKLRKKFEGHEEMEEMAHPRKNQVVDQSYFVNDAACTQEAYVIHEHNYIARRKVKTLLGPISDPVQPQTKMRQRAIQAAEARKKSFSTLGLIEEQEVDSNDSKTASVSDVQSEIFNEVMKERAEFVIQLQLADLYQTKHAA